jgi:hypothetical protein
MHLGCRSTFGKRKNTLACGSSIFTLSESLATSLVHGSRNPARKTIRYSFNPTHRDMGKRFVSYERSVTFHIIFIPRRDLACKLVEKFSY